MPLIVYDSKGLPATERERIEAAIVAGGRQAVKPAWIVANPNGGGIRVLLTGPHGFERRVIFAPTEELGIITQQVRQTLEED